MMFFFLIFFFFNILFVSHHIVVFELATPFGSNIVAFPYLRLLQNIRVESKRLISGKKKHSERRPSKKNTDKSDKSTISCNPIPE